MTQALKPYPAYKDPGVPWLREVPDHWKVVPNRAAFKEIKEKGHPNEEMLSVTITQGVIRQASLLSDTSKKDSSNEDKSKYKLVCPGDIAYNKMRAWQGAVGASNYRGIVSPAYIVVRPRENQNPRFFHYLFRTPAFTKEAERWSYGISSDQWSLRPEEFKQIYSCVPHLPEQTSIVRFLDYIDWRIRRYINANKRLITLLNEQKQCIIHQVVTRGLDPNVRLKPSGVEWLGDIPEHWEVRRLKWLVKNVNDQTNHKLPSDAYVALEHVEGWTGRLTIPDREIVFDSQVKRFSPNDVLFGKLRPYLAKVTRPQMKGVCVGEFFVLRIIDSRVLPEFIEHKLRSRQLIDLINSSTFGAKMPRADWNFVGNVAISYPANQEEQQRILTEIQNRTLEIQNVIDRSNCEIDLLREYRTRLIADVVTGKLDVREAAASLPEEAEQTEDIEELTDSEGMPEEVALEPAVAEATDED